MCARQKKETEINHVKTHIKLRKKKKHLLTSCSDVRRSVFLYETPPDPSTRSDWMVEELCLAALRSSSLDDDSSLCLAHKLAMF